MRTHVWTRTERTRAPDARRAQPAGARGAPCMYVDSRSFNHSDFNLLLSPPHCAPSITNHLRCQLFPLRTHTTVNTTAESVEEQTEEYERTLSPRGPRRSSQRSGPRSRPRPCALRRPKPQSGTRHRGAGFAAPLSLQHSCAHRALGSLSLDRRMGRCGARTLNQSAISTDTPRPRRFNRDSPWF